MNTITLTQKQEITKEYELQLPAYFKSNCHFLKVISEKQSLKITELSGHYTIEAHPYIPDLPNYPMDSTEAEFNEAWTKVLNELNQLKEKI